DFYRAIGPERIYRRIHELASRVRDGIKQRPQLRLANASAEPFFAGLVSFEATQGDLDRVLHECTARQIRTAGGRDRIRIATHIFTQQTELNALFDAVDRAAIPGN